MTMRFWMRQITVLMVALVIGVTSVQLAAARGQPPATGTMVICTGTGPVHILVDQNGVPTGGVMICPDYAMAFFADVWSQVSDVRRIDSWQDVWVAQPGVQRADQMRVDSQARGPPLAV